MIISFEHEGMTFTVELSDDDERAQKIKQNVLGPFSIAEPEPGGAGKELDLIPVYNNNKFSHFRTDEGAELTEGDVLALGLNPADYL
jgi:hypothetical protein